MKIEDIQIGHVLKWDDYPFAADEIIKRRYFVYLGKTNEFLALVLKAYLITGTTKIHYYEEGYDEESAKRIKNIHRKYDAGTLFLFASGYYIRLRS